MSWPFIHTLAGALRTWGLGLVIHTAFCGAISLTRVGKGLKNTGSISLVPGRYGSPVRKQLVIYVSLSVFMLYINWAQIFILWYAKITLVIHLGWYYLCMCCLYIASIILRYVPNISILSRTSIINWILDFIKRLLFASDEKILGFSSSFSSYVVDYIY